MERGKFGTRDGIIEFGSWMYGHLAISMFRGADARVPLLLLLRFSFTNSTLLRAFALRTIYFLAPDCNEKKPGNELLVSRILFFKYPFVSFW